MARLRAGFGTYPGFLVRSDLAARRQLRENAGRYALRDALTGLLNRPAFIERLEAALSRGTRHRRSLAVLCFELDGFAEVTGKFGKIASDQLLHQASKRVKDILRASDVLARVADLRFLALLDETVDRGDAATKAANIIELVGQPFTLQGGSGSVFTSVGISLFPDDDTRSGQLIQFAEAAMDKARQAGRGKFRFFSRREMESA
jgi:diguanylate cyclase (GGDEF)-like protein